MPGKRRALLPLSRPGRTRCAFVVTCEHGGAEIPEAYAALFRGARAALRSHRGFDLGALPVARLLSRALEAPLLASTTSRLLVDLNRSEGHPQLLSEWSKQASPAARKAILEEHYCPHRDAVARAVQKQIDSGTRVLHLAVHSFDPSLAKDRERIALGLLYDPSRSWERTLCSTLQRALQDRVARGQVRRNAPYRGANDGLTRALRRRWPDPDYAGVEIELNRTWVSTQRGQAHMTEVLVASLKQLGLAT